MEKYTRPVLIYDNFCTSCTNYAKWVDFLVKKKIKVIGHHTIEGINLKNEIFPKGYDGLEMSWFVTDTFAYGGRAGLFELIKFILFSKKSNKVMKNQFDLEQCTDECQTIKGIFMRSYSLLSQSKKIVIKS